MTKADIERIRMLAADKPTSMWSRVHLLARLRESREHVAALIAELERREREGCNACTERRDKLIAKLGPVR